VSVEVRPEPPGSPASRALFADYLALVRERLPGFTPSEAIFGADEAFDEPGSAWLVLYDDGAAVGCGGLRALEPGTGEIKRVFVRAGARGRGHGRRLLEALEAAARAAGQRRVRLLTTEVLREARGLYERAGYEVVSVHARDGRCDFWLEKRLDAATMLELVDIPAVSPEPFRGVLGPGMQAAFDEGVRQAREVLGGRQVWNVNSTARGGGVAELLRPLVGYARGAGVDARWAVIGGDPPFFMVTKRIHNRLHGVPGDGGPLDDAARAAYEGTLARNTEALAAELRPGDVVILHDPQTAGMTAGVKAAGATVVWRCHVGLDVPNELARDAWAFLRPYVLDADAYVFSRRAFAWEGLDERRVHLIAPSIDAFAPKNQELDAATVAAVVQAAGLVADGAAPAAATYHRLDGSPGRVAHRASLIEDAPLRPDDPVVLQVSRWDALKDPLGVIRGFAEHVPLAHLVYAGPAVEAVSDDPEGEQVLQEAVAARDALPAEARRRVHLAALPMDDPDENAIIVNALQRHARIVVQKSLAEGFGPHGGRGDVEGAARGGVAHRRHPGPDRGRRERRPARRPDRPRGLRRRRARAAGRPGAGRADGRSRARARAGRVPERPQPAAVPRADPSPRLTR
jgi:trehalose synthase